MSVSNWSSSVKVVNERLMIHQGVCKHWTGILEWNAGTGMTFEFALLGTCLVIICKSDTINNLQRAPLLQILMHGSTSDSTELPLHLQ